MAWITQGTGKEKSYYLQNKNTSTGRLWFKYSRFGLDTCKNSSFIEDFLSKPTCKKFGWI